MYFNEYKNIRSRNNVKKPLSLKSSDGSNLGEFANKINAAMSKQDIILKNKIAFTFRNF